MNLLPARNTIGVVNTGASNLQAVLRIIAKEGFAVKLLELGDGGREDFDCLVLPGIGHFGFVMNEIQQSGGDLWLKYLGASNMPIIGICLGAQLLFDSSEEAPGVSGLGFIPGSVLRLPPSEGYRSPHMGWNTVRFERHNELNNVGIVEKSFYFAHSFYLAPQDQENVIATSEHGFRFCTIAGSRNVLALQFHPEKSGRVGHHILKRSLEWLCQQD